MSKNLTDAMLNHDDLDTVKSATPAYLIMLDGFLLDDPRNINLLVADAKLYTAYASVFAREDPERFKRLTQRAFTHAKDAACLHKEEACDIRKQEFAEFKMMLSQLEKDDVPIFYTLGSSWAGWIQANSGDWNAIADLPRITAIMERVLELDETYQSGGAHLYLGITKSLLPPALGGKTEEAKIHFERAIELSNGQNLMVKVMYAERYARLVFDRDLHDRLLNEVITADPVAPDLTLMNTLAQQQASELLASADDYF